MNPQSKSKESKRFDPISEHLTAFAEILASHGYRRAAEVTALASRMLEGENEPLSVLEEIYPEP